MPLPKKIKKHEFPAGYVGFYPYQDAGAPQEKFCGKTSCISTIQKKTIKKKSTIGTAILFPISRKMKAKKKGNRHIANCEAITITTMPMLANAPLVTNVPIMLCNNSGKDRITMQAI